ncbi:MAG TPA: ferritin family protein, partial [Candidatus Aquicultoraceae bacterium]|nr:ferritin family protein [Candidatus Aquicultoraceae bacterium]
EAGPAMKKGAERPLSAGMAEGWKKALRNEVEGREFYRMAAANARLDGVRQVFTFLMEEEERHREALLERMGRTAGGGPVRVVRKPAGKKAGEFRGPLFPPDFVASGMAVDREAAALSIGMTLEKRSILQYTVLRRKSQGDAGAQTFFDDLIAWEREHLELLARQYARLREIFWEEARFWPF